MIHAAGSEPAVVKFLLGFSPFRENIQPELHQRPQQHGPQGDADERQLDVRQLLQLGAERQAEAQLEQHGRHVPGTQTQVRGAVARVVARLAATRHLDGQHKDEDAVKHPDRKEDEEPVPLHLEGGQEESHLYDQGIYHFLLKGHFLTWDERT